MPTLLYIIRAGEGEGEVAFFSAKRWDRRNRADLIESTTPCHDAQVVGPYQDSNPLPLTILAAMSEDYTTAPQHNSIQCSCSEIKPSQKESLVLHVTHTSPYKIQNLLYNPKLHQKEANKR